MSDKIKVLPVHPGLLGQAWPYVGPLLLRGEIECTPANDDPAVQMRDALTGLLNGIMMAHKGECIVWTVVDEAKRKVVAAMTSELVTDDGVKRLWVSRMAGEDIVSWGKALGDAMEAHAKAEGATAVRFWGRAGLKRAYGNVRSIKASEGMHLFERQVA